MSDPTPILDMCCGGRMMWYDKADHRATFVDQRDETLVCCDGRTVHIRPDLIADFRNLPFEDETFYHVVFDPPHLNRLGTSSWLAQKYRRLLPSWEDDIKRGFAEGMRVLKPNGTLIFKWNEIQIAISRLLPLFSTAPLYGHRSGKSGKTIWLAFIKTTD